MNAFGSKHAALRRRVSSSSIGSDSADSTFVAYITHFSTNSPNWRSFVLSLNVVARGLGGARAVEKR